MKNILVNNAFQILKIYFYPHKLTLKMIKMLRELALNSAENVLIIFLLILASIFVSGILWVYFYRKVRK